MSEEPYHYLQKKVGTILEELCIELETNLSVFKTICKEVYNVEKVIIGTRNAFVQASKEVEDETKKQQELEHVLDYFDNEVEKLRGSLKADTASSMTTPNYAVLGDIDSLVGEFNSLVTAMDTDVPHSVSIRISENINLIKYADALIKNALERKGKAEKHAAGLSDDEEGAFSTTPPMSLETEKSAHRSSLSYNRQ